MKRKTAFLCIGWIVAAILVIPAWVSSQVTWNPLSIETVLTPRGTGTWESVEVWHPNVMYDNGVYKMWYAGTTDRNGTGARGIGYATSVDGVTWQNRQLVYGPTSGYSQMDSPKVLKDGGTYKMWFREYYESIGGEWSGYVSYMTSSDGLTWTGNQKVLSAQGQAGANGDGYNITNLCVLKEGTQYTMWYAVDDLDAAGYKTWRATSPDGISWGNRALSLPYDGITWGAYDPDVVKGGDGKYTIYYTTGIPGISGSQLAAATGDDGITWGNRQLLNVGGHSPFYFEDLDGTPYLYFSNGGTIYRMTGSKVPELEPPIADAGGDQVVFSEVTLDASGSSDPDGTIVKYEWKLLHRGNPSYDRTAIGVSPTISNLAPGFYDVSLAVTDNDGAIGTATMLLAVAGECAGWPSPNGVLSLNVFNITQVKKTKAATALMSGKVKLPDLKLGSRVQGRVTVELFDALAGGGDCVLSDELSLKVQDSKQLLVIGK